ncbi:hypothetical protein TARUN_1107 [Trichoderma arundinaceum]|uniref:Beta-lactamase-related domain-containing protein n=1 Tax=Trichoderma arundinaceum TaxID=490622 RepID=A0A395NYE3_TRIAR|nr:hypothetical protein TARUN_1107 [Trichoderma arundinaceum]
MPFSAQTLSNVRDTVDKACVDPKTGIPGVTIVVVGKDGKELFAHSAGKRGLVSKDPMTLDTIFWIASCTKMLTGLACMQLVEQGTLKLDDGDHLESLLPELKEVKVLRENGTYEQKNKKITLRMLLSHTSGFGYTFFNERLRDWAFPAGANEFSGRIEDIISLPLLFQPGEGWEYGTGIDWAGLAVERATGLTLNTYLQKNILQPLGIQDMSMFPNKDMRNRLAYMHTRDPDGTIRPRDHLLRIPLVVDPDDESETRLVFNSGGAGMFARPQEYCKVLAVLLNDGTCPRTGTQLLRKETVNEMFRNQIPQFPNYSRQRIPASKADLTNAIGELYPVSGSPPQGWGLTFMKTNGGGTGRSTEAVHWAGLANLWWWCDRENGVAGIVCTQILPFADSQVLGLWADVEAQLANLHPVISSYTCASYSFIICCDQCRKAKRGCDARPLELGHRNAALEGPNGTLMSTNTPESLPEKNGLNYLSTLRGDILDDDAIYFPEDYTIPNSKRSYFISERAAGGFSCNVRIYSRAIQLDRQGISANRIRLTRGEDAAATKALHLVIMAFATQWAQGSYRQREIYSTAFASPNAQSPHNIADGLAEEFDRNLQHQIWAQAKRALQDVEELESYRVILAELIFGLTQKAWANDDDNDVDSDNMKIHSNGFDLKTKVLSRLNAIISKDGPPIYMERAARKVQTLQARYNAARRGLEPLMGNYIKTSTATRHSAFFLGNEHRKTAGLLYWFAVMFDTVSSSMNERPVVVPDEDIPYNSENDSNDSTSDQSEDPPMNERWDMRAFIHDDVKNPAYSPTWPCPYEDAAKAVTKSAPVKVLLFRHLSYLQGILRKGARGRKVEEIICSTISLYRYWNKTYGSFFREMMLDIYSIPARIRSWFFCISCHWNLAALMIADLIEFVDENNLGVDTETYIRVSGRTAWRIRDAGVKELSQLASIAIPCNGLQDASNFHHAVNEGTILTEPWTMILIRAFSMASAILLGEADDYLRHGAAELGYTSGEFEETLERVLNCIKALWHLGKKSDMARKAAEFLSLTTERLRIDYGIRVDSLPYYQLIQSYCCINLAFARFLLREGCSVIIGDLRLTPEAEELIKEFPHPSPYDHQPSALFQPTDVVSWPQLTSLWQMGLEMFPRIDIVIPGAGLYEPPWSSFWQPPRTETNPDSASLDDADAEPGHYAVLDVNLTAPIRLSQLAIGYWTQNKLPGCIVHLGSIAGYISGPATPLYYASKHGIHGFVKSLGDLRDRLSIRISAVAPGPVDTAIWLSDQARLNTLMKGATYVPVEEVVTAMHELIVNEEYGNGTILEVTPGATRVVPKFNASPPAAGALVVPNAPLYHKQLFNDLKTKGLQT